ncbi:MAG TPA: glycosyltransferase N-terminal domain-containing protein [Gammaproteobacteria bacterium]
MSLLLDLFYVLVLSLASPWILYRLASGRTWKLVPQRLGIGLDGEPRGCLWLHGSSVGEVSLLRPLVAMLERDLPQLELVISSYTQTGLAAARASYPQHRVVVFPLDFSFVVRRFLRKLEPRLVVIVESELWPNFLAVTRRHGIPTAVINGKMSQKSFGIHRRTRLIARGLSSLSVLAVQTDEHARRFGDLGVAKEAIRVTGNMKYDLAAPRGEAGVRTELRAALSFRPDEIVVIGGSLHPGEDLALLEAFVALLNDRGRCALILVPRYPADVELVARHVRDAGHELVLKSAVDRGAAAPGSRGVLVVDTVGELNRLYAAADVAFVGGSLFYRGANKGGHNLMEPAILGLPVLFGPYNFSFKETVADLLAVGGGVLARNGAELGQALSALVADDAARRRMGERARSVVVRGQGATARNYALIRDLLSAREARLQAPGANRTMPQAARDTHV